MLKIIKSKDPFFSVSKLKNVFEWKSLSVYENFQNLLIFMDKHNKVFVPFAENLFFDEQFALLFLQHDKKSNCEVVFYCKNMDFPTFLLDYAEMESEEIETDFFDDRIKELNFSTNVFESLKANLKGIPFSLSLKLIEKMDSLNEKEALNLVLKAKSELLKNNDVLEVVSVKKDISDIGGLEELKDWIVKRKNNFSQKSKEFGIPTPKGVLMLGVQGCGKSLTAKVIANIWNFPLVRLDFINLFKQNKSVEELLKESIEIVEAFSPVVLWIDEIEKALFQDGNSGEIRRLLGWLMTWMQEKELPVFLVATANKVKMLPPELLRKGRFDEIFFIDLPSLKERKEIFKIHLLARNRKPENFDVDNLAKITENFSGAEIEQIIIDALITDFSKKQELSQRTLEEIIRKTIPLSITYEDNIKELRSWARNRARNASGNVKIESFFKSE